MNIDYWLQFQIQQRHNDQEMKVKNKLILFIKILFHFDNDI